MRTDWHVNVPHDFFTVQVIFTQSEPFFYAPIHFFCLALYLFYGVRYVIYFRQIPKPLP